MTGTRRDDLLLAANEAVINVLEHGGGVGTVTFWHDEEGVSVEISDTVGLLTPRDVDRGAPPRTRTGLRAVADGPVVRRIHHPPAGGAIHRPAPDAPAPRLRAPAGCRRAPAGRRHARVIAGRSAARSLFSGMRAPLPSPPTAERGITPVSDRMK
ncbi:ATP-binding protein [Streptosporangium lutulentum]